MTEIEKLYKNAGVKAINIAEYGSTYIPAGVEINGHLYPPFTAEKQLELIKWLVKNQDIFKITYHREFLWCSSIEWVESDCYEEFEESLADLINTVWQDLTDAEKAQINGSLVHITGIFGLTLAGLIMQDAVKATM